MTRSGIHRGGVDNPTKPGKTSKHFISRSCRYSRGWTIDPLPAKKLWEVQDTTSFMASQVKTEASLGRTDPQGRPHSMTDSRDAREVCSQYEHQVAVSTCSYSCVRQLSAYDRFNNVQLAMKQGRHSALCRRYTQRSLAHGYMGTPGEAATIGGSLPSAWLPAWGYHEENEKPRLTEIEMV